MVVRLSSRSVRSNLANELATIAIPCLGCSVASFGEQQDMAPKAVSFDSGALNQDYR